MSVLYVLCLERFRTAHEEEDESELDISNLKTASKALNDTHIHENISLLPSNTFKQPGSRY
jgi:hypothetical protein